MDNAQSDAFPMVATSFTFRSVPELVRMEERLNEVTGGKGLEVLHLISLSLMLSDIKGYAEEVLEGIPREDISQQSISCQSALLKALYGLGMTLELLQEAGAVLHAAIVLHAVGPTPGEGLN